MATLLRRPWLALAPARPFVRFERIGRFAVFAPQPASLAPEGSTGPVEVAWWEPCVPHHFNGRNPYSRHKRSVAATTSGRSRISES